MKLLIFIMKLPLPIGFIEHSSLILGLMEGASSKTGTLANPGGGVIFAENDCGALEICPPEHFMLSAMGTGET